MPDGRAGSVDMAGLGVSISLRITRWNADTQRELFISTGFGDAGSFNAREPGMGDMTGTAEGFSPSNAPFPDALFTTLIAAKLTLIAASGRFITCNAFVSTKGQVVQRVGALNAFTFSFASTGTVYES